MKPWEALVESRVREWQARKERGDAMPAPTSEPTDSLEAQLFAKVVELHGTARATGDQQERAELVRQAEQTRIRLVILLEKSDLPLLAQSLDDRIAAALADASADDKPDGGDANG